MRVEIVSIQAALAGRASIIWIGDISERDLVNGSAPETPTAVNEALFRFFNRVDEADSDRLQSIGFELPSLSVGDLVHWNSVTWRVAGMGFEQLTHSGDYAVALARYALASATSEPPDHDSDEEVPS